MSEDIRRSQIDAIKEELEGFKKAELSEALTDRGIHPTGKEKKEELLEMLAVSILDDSENTTEKRAENLASEEKKAENGTTAHKDDKTPAKAKTTAKPRRSRGGKVQEITKKRRENVKEIKKVLFETEKEGNSEARLYREEEEPELIPVEAAPRDKRRKAPAYLKDEDIELIETMNDPTKILTGRMEYTYVDKKQWTEKTHPRTGEKIRCYNIAAGVRYKSRIVYIPAEYFLDNYYDLDQQYMKRFIENRVGADVDFRVVNASTENPERPVYIGSRIDAMALERKEYWYSDRAIGQSLEVGEIHEARISAVGEGLIFVELYGVETAITQKHVSYTKHMRTNSEGKDDGLKAIYFPGETEKVLIKEIAKADSRRAEALGYPVRCVMSIREAKEDTRDIYFMQDIQGMLFRGVVNNIAVNRENKVEYFIEMNGHLELKDIKERENLTINCALAEKCLVPRVGSIVSGRITYVNDRQKRAFGTIYHVDRL